MKIVVAYDGSPGAQAAVRASVPLARASRARLVLLWVIDPRSDLGGIRGSHSEALLKATRDAEVSAQDFAADQYDGVEVRVELQERGEDPGEALARHAKAMAADIVVAATRRAGGLTGFFLGSVTQQLIRESACPVMVVRV